MSDRLNPNQRCSTCAFRTDKNGASGEPDNALRGTIAAMGGVPFLCHHAPDGRELNWRHGALEFLKSMRSRRDRRVCAGWKAQVLQYHRAGRFKNYKVILHSMAEYAMRQLDIFIAADDKTTKDEAHRELESALAVLRKRSNGQPVRVRRGDL